MNPELVGMWKYAQSKKFRLNRRNVSMKVLCLKLDKGVSTLPLTLCGTRFLNEDCPFFCQTDESLCLAPNRDFEYAKMRRSGNPFNKDMVVGCYILPYCEKGYKRYQGIKAWIRRARK